MPLTNQFFSLKDYLALMGFTCSNAFETMSVASTLNLRG